MQRLDILKIVAIVLIGLALFVPLLMIHSVVRERSVFRDQARRDIAQAWTGPQKLMGPMLTIPYGIGSNRAFVFPDTLEIQSSLTTEMRKRGLYSVPVYSTEIQISGVFDLAAEETLTGPGGVPWVTNEGFLSIALSDNRGIVEHPRLDWDGTKISFAPGAKIPGSLAGIHAEVGYVEPGSDRRIPFSMTLVLRGMESLQFAPVGKDTRVVVSSAWPHPKFVGRFLPVEREVNDGGFSADWRVSHLASGATQSLAELRDGKSEHLGSNTFGVELIEPVDVYQQTDRSVKYGNLFIVLTFTAFFLIELLRRMQLHPIQYLLVGLALAMFFLLLLSLSEHMAFGLAYAIAAVACVALIAIYMASALGLGTGGFGVGGVLGALYGMLYIILRSEDNALLMGSLLLFLALALLMYLTRKIDWYRAVRPDTPARPG